MIALLGIVFALVLAGVLAPLGARALRSRAAASPAARSQAALATQAATVASVASAALPYYAKAFYAHGPQDGYLLPPPATTARPR